MTSRDVTPVADRGMPDPVAAAVDQVARELGVDPAVGLSAEEVGARLASHGPNRLAAGKKEPGWQAFLRQYQDFMQIVLLVAAVDQPDRHRGDRHHGRAGRADGLQRRDRPAPGGQGRGERQGARPDDEDDRPGAPRRPGGRDRRRGAGARRRRAGRGRQPRPRRRPGLSWPRRWRSRRPRSPARACRSASRPSRCRATTSRSATGPAWPT